MTSARTGKTAVRVVALLALLPLWVLAPARDAARAAPPRAALSWPGPAQAAAAPWAPANPLTATLVYSLTDLGTLGGVASQAVGINELGQVVGAAQNAAGQMRAFVWAPEATASFRPA